MADENDFCFVICSSLNVLSVSFTSGTRGVLALPPRFFQNNAFFMQFWAKGPPGVKILLPPNPKTKFLNLPLVIGVRLSVAFGV